VKGDISEEAKRVSVLVLNKKLVHLLVMETKFTISLNHYIEQ
jgi:hypothetical protein